MTRAEIQEKGVNALNSGAIVYHESSVVDFYGRCQPSWGASLMQHCPEIVESFQEAVEEEAFNRAIRQYKNLSYPSKKALHISAFDKLNTSSLHQDHLSLIRQHI